MKKRVRRVICVILAFVVMLSSSAIVAFADNENTMICDTLDFTFSPFENCKIKPIKSVIENSYFVYMPSYSNLSALRVDTGKHRLSVNDEVIEDGKVTDAFRSGGKYNIELDGVQYTLIFMQSENLPSVYIKTESGNLDYVIAKKANKERADIIISENGKITASTTLDYIKGRGNSTWTEPKKPFNIKFTEKIDLFGMGKAKKWSLIASARELSLIRNKTVYDLADDVKLNFSPSSQHIDLYINDEYAGNYLVVESVEVKKNRVDIFDLEEANELANPSIDIESCPRGGDIDEEGGYHLSSKKWVDIPNDPENITGGYLLEFEQQNRYNKEISGFVTDIGQPVTFKSPEYATKSEVDYISAYYQEFEDAVYSPDGKNSKGKYYTDYIDLDLMARMYIIQELTMNVDASTTSFYLYKDINSDKFVASPVWDFDFSLGETISRCGVDLTDPNPWYVRAHYINDDRGLFLAKNNTFATLLTQLCSHEDFIAAVEEEWKVTFLPQVGKNRVKQIQNLAETLVPSSLMESVRWNKFSSTDPKVNAAEYKKLTDGVVNFFKKRVSVLSKGLSSDNADLLYNANGGSGCTYNNTVVSVGETVEVKRNNFKAPGFRYVFDSWNTKPDGSGKAYKSGNEIKLTEKRTTLYAQWKEIPGFAAVCGYITRTLFTVLTVIIRNIIRHF